MTLTELLNFIKKHPLGVLATVSVRGVPEAALVGIAVTDQFELIFDTIDTTRKCKNLRQYPNAAFVIGWDNEITVQYEGIADEPAGNELDRLKKIYFEVYPDGLSRQSWSGITYFRVGPKWIRYSNFKEPVTIIEFTKDELNKFINNK